MNRTTEFNHRKKNRIVYIMGGKCCLCGYKKCTAALEMHHIDMSEKEFTFSHYNHYMSIENMKDEMKKCALVCSNCHKEIHYDNEEKNISSTFNNERFDEIVNEIHNTKSVITTATKYCKKCGKNISYRATLCTKCKAEQARVVEHPSRNELKEMIRTESFEQIGRKYGVTGKSIVKWCINMKLPSKRKDIEKISDKEWESI